MIRQVFLFLILLGTNRLISITSCNADERKDPRLSLISLSQLQQMIKNTPIQSPQHFRFISRASNVGLTKPAYEAYAALQKKSDNADTNLLKGLAAQRYMTSWDASLKQSPELQSRLKQSYELRRIVRSSLSKAVQLRPDSATANVA